MSHFKKIGIYAKNRTSSVISAIKKLEKSLESFGCNIFFEKTSGLQLGIKRDTFLEIDSFCDEIDLLFLFEGMEVCSLHVGELPMLMCLCSV